jgi:uncharacterized glyoxalase superfamily protein PhnB
VSGDAASETAGITLHLTYERPGDAVEWLCRGFGLRETTRMNPFNGNAPSMLCGPCGGNVVIWGLTEDFKDWMRARAPRFHEPGERPWPYLSHSVSVHVADVDRHYERSQRESASILSQPTDQPWGVRSYAALDPEGHQWEFLQAPRAANGPDPEAAA